MSDTTDGFNLSGLSTEGKVMSDYLGSVGKAQGVKLVVGADGVNGGYVDSANPLPVLLTAGGSSIGSATLTAVVPGTSATQLGKAVDSPAGGTDTGVAVLAVRTTTPATVTPANGDWVPLRTDDQGSLRVNITSGGSQASIDDSAFTAGSTEVVPVAFLADETSTDSVDENDMGAARMTLDRKQIVTPYAHTAGGATPVTYVSAASTNATLVKNSAGQIYTVICTNINASARYLKIFDKSTSPTVGTDVPVQNYMIPGNSNGFVIALPMPLQFTSGIAFAITTGIALTDAVC
jgi:hypothetical protein